MKAIKLMILLLALSLAAFGQKSQPKHGFRLIEKRFVKEVNADCYFFEHEKSGARLLKIAAPDPNKTFCIAFHTIPESDGGTPHILEHCVLNGSEHFPVKSPFDVIVKGSLKTFVNAFTGKDMTYYPIASMNEKDYFNLMHIYLDAVYKPLIYKDERIFKQEGWHYELTGIDDPLVYRGIVYGEMKGAYSNSARYVTYHTYRNLFPDCGYGYESGGFPSAIPALTWEAFTQYHKKYYHPDNSYIILYGDADLDKELAFINDKYLSGFERSGKKITMGYQAPFTSMKRVKEYYPVMENAATEKQTFLSLSFVFGEGKNQLLSDGMSLLAQLMVNSESAPVRLALQKAGIGSDVNAGVSSYKQNVMQITVRNAEADQAERFLEIVMEEFSKVASQGIDVPRMEALINRYEFSQRENNDAQKGLSYAQQLLPMFIYDNNPIAGLTYEENLKALKAGLKTGFYEDILRNAFIENPHALLLSVEPKPGMDKALNAKTEEMLQQRKENLSDEAKKALINETHELIAYQNREDAPEALATIPMLSKKDINPKASFHQTLVKKEQNMTVLHHEAFTNNILYCNLFFDLRAIPENLLPYAALLSEVLGSMNTEQYTFAALDDQLNNHTGGFFTYLTRFLENNDDSKLIPKFVATVKATRDKAGYMFDLSSEILLNTRLNDPERLKSLIERHHSQLESRIKSDGSGISNTRLRSYYSRDGLFDEITGGYDYYTFIAGLSASFDEKSGEIIQKLTETADKLFKRENLITGITCSSEDYKAFALGLQEFGKKMPEGKVAYGTWNLKPVIKNEGFLSASKVQYVNSGYNFKKLGYEWNGSMMVLNQIISREWLYKQIRVVGGAYGGYSTISSNGNVAMISYRDPNFTETLESFRSTAAFLKNFTADESQMNQFIIGTISKLDQPLRVSQQGDRAFYNHFTGLTADAYQKERNEVLNTTLGDITRYAEMIGKVLSQEVQCTYGNAEILEAQKGMFKQQVRI